MLISSGLTALIFSSIVIFWAGKKVGAHYVVKRLLMKGGSLPSIMTIRRVKSEGASAVTATVELSDGTVTHDFFFKWPSM